LPDPQRALFVPTDMRSTLGCVLGVWHSETVELVAAQCGFWGG
jgi:hypothetical protein